MQEHQILLNLAIENLNKVSVTGYNNAKALTNALECIDKALYQLQHPPDEQIEDKQE